MNNSFLVSQTLFAHLRPHALQRVLRPAGPRRIIGVFLELIPQCVHLQRKFMQNNEEKIKKRIYRKSLLLTHNK